MPINVSMASKGPSSYKIVAAYCLSNPSEEVINTGIELKFSEIQIKAAYKTHPVFAYKNRTKQGNQHTGK